jgi:hypothetical protein
VGEKKSIIMKYPGNKKNPCQRGVVREKGEFSSSS